MAKKGIFYKLGRAISNVSGSKGYHPDAEYKGVRIKEEILEEGKELSQCFYCGDATTTQCSVCGKSACRKPENSPKQLPSAMTSADANKSASEAAASVFAQRETVLIVFPRFGSIQNAVIMERTRFHGGKGSGRTANDPR